MKNIEINIIDKWEDITLEKYEEILTLYKDTDNKPRLSQLIAILSDLSVEEIDNLPSTITEKLEAKIAFIATPISNEENNAIIINNERYIINVNEKLKFGEFVDTQMLMKNDATNMSGLLSILCRKEGELYNDDYIANKFNERQQMFKKQPITTIYPLIFFLGNKTKNLETITAMYSTVLFDLIDQLLTRCESSIMNGGGKRPFTRYKKKRLAILRKQLNSI